MPYSATTHVDQALTTLSIAYQNSMYVADDVLPPLPVDLRSNLYFIYDKEAFKRMDDLVRPGGVAPEWERTVSRGFYNAERHAQRMLVTDDERQMSDIPLQPDVDSTEAVTDRVMNMREYATIGLVTDPTQVVQNVALSTGSFWSDYVNGAPLTNLRTARSAVRLGVLHEANALTISYDVGLALADHPSIKDLLKYTHPDSLTSSGLPQVVRGLKVNEAGAFVDSANEGQAATLSTAFGKNALVHYTSPQAGLKTISFGWAFEAPDATTGVRGFATEKYRDDPRHGDWVEVATTYALVLVAPLGGYLFTTAVQ